MKNHSNFWKGQGVGQKQTFSQFLSFLENNLRTVARRNPNIQFRKGPKSGQTWVWISDRKKCLVFGCSKSWVLLAFYCHNFFLIKRPCFFIPRFVSRFQMLKNLQNVNENVPILDIVRNPNCLGMGLKSPVLNPKHVRISALYGIFIRKFLHHVIAEEVLNLGARGRRKGAIPLSPWTPTLLICRKVSSYRLAAEIFSLVLESFVISVQVL